MPHLTNLNSDDLACGDLCVLAQRKNGFAVNVVLARLSTKTYLTARRKGAEPSYMRFEEVVALRCHISGGQLLFAQTLYVTSWGGAFTVYPDSYPLRGRIAGTLDVTDTRACKAFLKECVRAYATAFENLPMQPEEKPVMNVTVRKPWRA